jgi:hypothetical protein
MTTVNIPAGFPVSDTSQGRQPCRKPHRRGYSLAFDCAGILTAIARAKHSPQQKLTVIKAAVLD